jgi:hypothetical protein
MRARVRVCVETSAFVCVTRLRGRQTQCKPPAAGPAPRRRRPPPPPPQAYIGPPSERARYEVLRSAVQELGRAGIIGDLPPGRPLPSYSELQAAGPPAPRQQQQGAPGAAGAGQRQQQQHEQQQAQQQQQRPAAGGEDMATDGPPGPAAAADAAGPGPGPAGAAGGDGDSGAGGALALGRLLWAAAAAAEGFSGRALRKLPFLAHASGPGLPAPCGCAEFLSALSAAAEAERADRSSLASG